MIQIEVFVVALIALISFSEQKFSFDGYHLIKIIPENEKQLDLLNKWQINDPEFDVWNSLRGLNNGVDVALSSQNYEKYKLIFDFHGFSHTILVQNIQDKIDEEAESIVRSKLGKTDQLKIAGTYARHTNINIWLDMIATANTQYASTYITGKTIQGRDLKVLKLKTANTKRSIWIDCGIHAREWISVSTCIWFIDKITSDYHLGESVAVDILNHYEIHILPVVNPDGYEYTQTTSRLWRKNRFLNPGSTCYGIDLNRNFNYQWMVAGASNNPCSDTYAGENSNDQLETRAVQQAINSKRGEWDAFITFHSYGQLFLTPWGYTLDFPNDYDLLEEVANVTRNAIKQLYGTEFTFGTSGNVLYYSSGSSRDWAYGDAKIKYCYTLELRPGSSTPDASYGFVLPVSYIEPVGREMYDGLRTLFQTIKSK